MASTPSELPGNILVVDDTPDNLRLLVSLLNRYNYKVRVVNNGLMALKAVHVNPPDLILLDIMMPEMNGYEVCRRLKAEKRTADIPVIFISAKDEMQDKVRGFAVGGVDYINRPFYAEEVLARIHTHLSLRNVQKTLEEKNQQLYEANVALAREVRQRTQAEAALQRHAQQLQTRHEIDQSVLAARSPETIAMAAAGRIRQLIPCQRAMLFEVQNSGELRTLAVDAEAGLPSHIHPEVYRRLIEYGPVRKGRIQGFDNLGTLSNPSPDQKTLYESGIKSYMIVPLYIHDELVGILTLETIRPGVFMDEHINIATEVAILLAMALWQSRLYVRAQRELAERKRAEMALRAYAKELEANNAELDAFAHTVAHDLKNPLTALVAASHLIEKQYVAMTPDQLSEYVHMISNSGRKMANIIDELLLLSSVRKVDTLIKEPVDMKAVVTEACERLKDMLADAKAELNVPSAWPKAVAYAPWIEEVWVNYISNAVKYGGDPEKQVPPRIELGFDGQWSGKVRTESNDATEDHASTGRSSPFVGEQLRFWVRDNGPGLTQEEQSQLFTQFTRLHQVRAQGHGLGLSIVRRIVEKLGGEVGVESIVGKGSTFYFTLPSVLVRDSHTTFITNANKG